MHKRKGRLKKKNLITSFIILILCCSLFIPTCFAKQNKAIAQDETELEMARKGIESYTAWYTIEHGGYDFYMNRFENPARTVAERNKRDPSYSTNMLLWRIHTFSVEQEAKYATSEIGYYETFLFNMLYNEENDSFLNEFADQYSSDIKTYQTFEKALGTSAVSSVCNAYEKLGEIWKLPESAEEIEKFEQSLQKADNIKGAMDIVGDATKYIGYVKTANDLVNRLAKLQSIINASTKEGEILEELSGESNENTAMQLALKEYSAYTKEAISPETADAIMTKSVVGSEVLKGISKEVFDKALLAAGGYGFAVVNAGQKVGKFVANAAFNAEAIMAAEYKIDAVYNLDTLLRKKLKTYEKDFFENPTEEKAQKFNTALKMFYKLQLDSMDCYKEFIDAVYHKGLGINFFKKDLTKEKHQEMVDDITSIKNSIRETMESDRELSVTLYTEILPEINTNLEADQIPEKLTPVMTEKEKPQVLAMVETDIRPYGMGNIKNDFILTDDTEVYGDVHLENGTLNLNGHKLTINGNLYQEGGSIVIKKGTLEVGGDYYIAEVSENEVGEKQYNKVDAYLKMMCAEDQVIVHGNFVTKSMNSHESYLTAGTMYIAGNFVEKYYGNSSYYNFEATNDHKVVLNGTGVQKIEIDSPYSEFATLDIENSNVITVKGYFQASTFKTDMDKINIVSDGMQMVKTILWNDVNIKGDVCLDSNSIDSGINLNGHKLTIEGNLYQEDNELVIAKGILEVTGNYYIAEVYKNEVGEEQYNRTNGYLKMMCAEDQVIVHGTFATNSTGYHSAYLTAGTMYIGGDFIEKADSAKQNFDATDQHKVILNGNVPQKIEINDPYSGFGILDVENNNEITIKGYFRANSLETNLNKINMLSKRVEITKTTLSDNVEIKGDVYIKSYYATGNINLKGYKLTVDGNLYQSANELVIAKGILNVTGNYYIADLYQNEVGEEQYNRADAYLKMMCPEDQVIVHGTFLTNSRNSHSSYFAAGTMYISGDFIEKSDSGNYNFNATDDHKVVLNGTGAQKIEMDDPYSGFAALDIENSNAITVKGYFRANSMETSLNKINMISEGVKLTKVTLLNDVYIKGDVKIFDYINDKTINLKGHKLTVDGNLYQEANELVIARGMLEVTGNYYIAEVYKNEVGEDQYNEVTAYLKMMCPEDIVMVRGDFLTKARYSHSSYLTAGAMYVGGDFTQKKESSYSNFDATNQHKVVLNGVKPQVITFESYDSSHFNILQLTQDKSQYTFNPEPCWNEIQENVKVEPEFDNTILAYGTCGDDAKWTVNNQGVLHIYGSGDTYDYDPNNKSNTIRTPWEKYYKDITKIELDDGITKIGNYLFGCLSNVESLEIPKSVTGIGNFAFTHCGIITFKIPDTVKNVGEGIFANCKQLTEVSFPSSLTDIPNYTFWFCSNLKQYTVPEQMTRIGRCAFEGCLNLETVNLPEGLEVIDEYAFNTKDSTFTADEWNARKELVSISLPSTLTTIGDYAFRGCCFEKVIVPDSVVNYGGGIFNYCKNLKEVHLPKGLEKLNGFEECTALETVKIPDTVKEISHFGFANSGIVTIELPNGLEKIGDSAFYGCKNIEDIVIPKKVANIGRYAFGWCEHLKTITFCGDAPKEVQIVMGDNKHTLKNDVYYPANNATWTEEVMNKMGPDATWIPYGEEEIVAKGNCGEKLEWKLDSKGILRISGSGTMKNYTYKSEMPWFKYIDQINSVKVEEGVTSIGEYAFYGMPNMTEIQLPKGLKTIGGYAFKNSTKLNKVELPDTITKLGESAFYGCTGLTKINIPEGIYTIWAYTFKNCTNLAEVTLPSTLIKLDEAAFYGCSALKEINIPEKVSIIGIYCFKNCNNLSSLTLPEALTSVREAAFYGTAITELAIPKDVKTIGAYAFKNCTKLNNIQLPEALEKINDSAFYSCTALTTLEIPNNVTKICDYAFRKCTGIQNVKFSENLTTIGESAFYGCSGINELNLPQGVTSIGSYAFKSCTNVTRVQMPAALGKIAESTFYGCEKIAEIDIPEAVKSIENYAFASCAGLHTIRFSGDRPEIGAYAFARVTAEIFYPGENPTWTEDKLVNYGGQLKWNNTAEKTNEETAENETMTEENSTEEALENAEENKEISEEQLPETEGTEEINSNISERGEEQSQEQEEREQNEEGSEKVEPLK